MKNEISLDHSAEKNTGALFEVAVKYFSGHVELFDEPIRI